MIIVIDDERTFRTGELLPMVEVKYARTSMEGLAAIAKAWTDYVVNYGNMVDLYLDHDLGENDTIGKVVDFLWVAGKSGNSDVCTLPDVIANIFVHSQNPTAGDMILPMLQPLYNNVKRIALPDLV